MRELVLLRHGEAEPRAPKDFDRQLTDRGRLEAIAAGRKLQTLGWRPDVVLASPAPRALRTCLEACQVVGFPTEAVLQVPAIYDATVSALRGILAAVPATSKRVMLVGHNPGLSELASLIVDDDRVDARGLPTGGFVWCTLSDDWSELTEGAAIQHVLD